MHVVLCMVTPSTSPQCTRICLVYFRVRIRCKWRPNCNAVMAHVTFWPHYAICSYHVLMLECVWHVWQVLACTIRLSAMPVVVSCGQTRSWWRVSNCVRLCIIWEFCSIGIFIFLHFLTRSTQKNVLQKVFVDMPLDSPCYVNHLITSRRSWMAFFCTLSARKKVNMKLKIKISFKIIVIIHLHVKLIWVTTTLTCSKPTHLISMVLLQTAETITIIIAITWNGIRQIKTIIPLT